jgi:HEPN domain-containing protein
LSGPIDSSYPEDWLRIARRDWLRVGTAIFAEDADLAGFLLQQSLEKYLKAFLLSRGWKLRRTHELDALLDTACSFDEALERFRDLCERVSGYYLAERYPVLGVSGLELRDIVADVAEGRHFIHAMHPPELLP